MFDFSKYMMEDLKGHFSKFRKWIVGDELEYTDEITLGRSIVNRTAFNGTV